MATIARRAARIRIVAATQPCGLRVSLLHYSPGKTTGGRPHDLSLNGCGEHANFKALRAAECACPACGRINDVFNDELDRARCEQCGARIMPRNALTDIPEQK